MRRYLVIGLSFLLLLLLVGCSATDPYKGDMYVSGNYYADGEQLVAPAYGQLFNDETGAAITVVNAGTYYLVTGWTVGLAHLTTPNALTSTITIGTKGNGVYLASVNVGAMNNGANRTAHIGLFVNNVEKTNVDMEILFPTANAIGSMGSTGLVNLAEGDVVDLRVTSSTNGDVVTFNHASLTINRVGK